MNDCTSALCPKSSICELFQDKILQGPEEDNVYKMIYCKTGRYKDCVRYKTYRKTGTCPDFIMPNSKHANDYILKKVEEEEETLPLKGLNQ